MTTYPCACSRGSSPTPGVPCASCLARRTPRALPPLAPLARAGFVRALPVAPAPPRRCDPLPPLRESYGRAPRVEAPCILGCGALAVGIDPHRRGPAPTPGTEVLCMRCRKAELRKRREIAAALGDA